MPTASRSDIPVRRGDRVSLTIERLGDGPDGIGRVGDYVVFVPGVLPGEQALVEITSAARKFGRGRVLELDRSSKERVEPRCAHFLDCGGCHLQHQHYAAQLRDKQGRLQRSLDHTLGDDAPAVAATVPAADPYYQRHKVVLHLHNDPERGLVPAFHRLRSLDLVPVDECPASEPRAFALAHRTATLLATLGHRAWDPDFARDGILRSVLVRRSTLGEAHVVIVARQDHVPGLDRVLDAITRAGATTISVNHNDGEASRLLGPRTRIVAGPDRIRERIGAFEHPLAPTSFFQTAPRMAERIVAAVVDALAPDRRDHVADLYCGAGLLTLPLAARAKSATGVEASGSAVADARRAAEQNRITNATFVAGFTNRWLADVEQGRGPRPDLVALDPPRTGLDDGVAAALGRLAPRRIAYVSCDPLALARDLSALAGHGFRVCSVTPFDMFPQTAHIEAVAVLEHPGA